MWPTLDDYFENNCFGKDSCQFDLKELLLAGKATKENDLRPIECSQNNAGKKSDIIDFAY